ncbi:MAG TPA: hypothetical protein VMZ25_10095 [Terriglobales bacterium]|nr:hypothetical protein [Terriglobales bacterium]
MNQGPNPPQNPGGGGGRRRRRRRGASGKKPHQPGTQPVQHGKPQGQGPRAQGGGGASNRRNRPRRGTQSFVGPMDHSYRNGNMANGNVADGHGQGRFRGGHQVPQKFVQNDMTPVAGSADGPARIFCFIEDLFFLAKIQETSKKLNIKVEFVKTPDTILERAAEDAPEDEKPTLIVFDLNNHNAKPLTLIPKLRSKLKKATSIIGFVSHIQGDLKLKALEAGCDSVMPRSAFSQNLPNLLRRHGAPEEVNDGTDQQHYIQ